MLIGDRGLRALHRGLADFPLTYDLGEIWTAKTGLPFVYAVFAAKKGVPLGDGPGRLLSAKEQGEGLVSEIAEAEAERLGLGREQCATHLGNRIRYGLGDPEIEGLMRYRELLASLGEIEAGGGIEFYADSPEAERQEQGE